MKSSKLFLIGIALFFTGNIFSQSENKSKTTPSSDQASGYTYNFDKTKQLIVDRITNPSAFNADVKLLVEASDFPQPTEKNLSADFYEKLRQWMEKNPNLIINTLKHRKDIVTPF